MADDRIEAEGKKEGDGNDASKKLLDDTRFASSSLEFAGMSKTGRQTYALAEGISLAPHGALKAAEHALHNPKEAAMIFGGGLLFGVGMRAVLPKNGAMKALAGTVMTTFMVHDVVKPMSETWLEAGQATDMNGVHKAAGKLGDGLGNFTVHSTLAMGGGIIGELGTGAMLMRSAGGRKFEAWKEYKFNSDETAIGRVFKGSERIADTTSDAVALKLLGEKSKIGRQISIEEKIRLMEEHGKKFHATEHGHGEGKNSLDLEGMKQHKRKYRNEFTERIDALLGEKAAIASGEPTKMPGVLAERKAILGPDGHPLEGTGPAKPGTAGDGKIIITDAAAQPAGTVVREPMTAETIGDMATTMRAATGRVTKEQMMVAQVKEELGEPLVSAMRSGEAPLDPGHFPNNELLIALVAQIQNAKHVQEAGPLVSHFSGADGQINLAASGDKGLFIVTDYNNWSASIHRGLFQRFDKHGIPHDVVRGSNSPLFTIRDTDGAGPYTIPAIRQGNVKVTDAAVVALPREHVIAKMEGLTSPWNAHELGHDVIYGDILKFPAEVRDSILNERVVGDAMKGAKVADVEIPVPGSATGTMKKSEFFVEVLRAQANENTADMFGAAIDPNGPLGLAVLLGALRKPPGSNPKGPGLLETRSVYGKEMVDAEMGNNLGIEVHGIDKWRIKLGAETLRQLSNGHEPTVKYANSMDGLAETVSRPGNNYVWASADKEGAFVAIPQREMDALIPYLVKAQLDTPLAALTSKTGERKSLRDIWPSMAETFPKVDKLSSDMADAALAGKTTVPGFIKAEYKIEDVFSSGMQAWMKAVAKAKDTDSKVTPEQLMTRINDLSATLRSEYRGDNYMPPGANASGHGIIADLALKPFNMFARATGHLAETQPRIRERFADWAPRTGGYVGGVWVAPPASEFVKKAADFVKDKAFSDEVLKPSEPTK